ncbi:carbohydrate ABC transporter permease [Compostimonas suwonensis]|uniref:Multiple sugar transport system permease protein n=1 Tax=Compostimonas suwonensis TaxID=1048394 RepID=A0A2M9C4W5_9MICO|nr:sugar ABC transporter permease [Compostimonas suwonensis]PJJ65507.1 multiple sugar transport system permease protein [Compostimonas suwonensis]
MSKGIRGAEGRYGWLFTSPAIIIIGVFLVLPIFLALWVSFSNWNGLGSPLGGTAEFVGLQNYQDVLVDPGLAQKDFGTSIRNNLYYVILVIPCQTALALFLAVQVNRRILRGRGFFRTAFYFPSVTSSIAITVVFLFLFSASGVVNQLLALIGVSGPTWFADPSGIIHNFLQLFGVDSAPPALATAGPLGLSWWDWLSGPSVAMCALIILSIFTTSGTFMLLFLAALQNVGAEVEEAAVMDGAGAFRKFFSVTLPMLKPTLFTVLTLGLIGTWQVFDQIYLTGGGSPGKTLLTPAYLAYETSFTDLKWGRGAAIAFILFAIIVVLTLLQRFILRDRDEKPKRGRRRRPGGGTDGAPPSPPGGPSQEAVLADLARVEAGPRGGSATPSRGTTGGGRA